MQPRRLLPRRHARIDELPRDALHHGLLGVPHGAGRARRDAAPRTTSEQLSGSFKRNALTATFTRNVRPGPLRGVATGSAKGKAASVTVTLRDAQGALLATRSGTSVDVQAVAAAAGADSWTISGANGVS